MWFLIFHFAIQFQITAIALFSPQCCEMNGKRENPLLPGQLPSLTGRHFRGEVFSATKKHIFPILIADIAANVAFRQQTRLFRDKRNQSTKYSERNPHLMPEPGRRVGMHSCVFPHLHVFPQAAFIREDSNHSDCMENPERSKSKKEVVKKRGQEWKCRNEKTAARLNWDVGEQIRWKEKQGFKSSCISMPMSGGKAKLLGNIFKLKILIEKIAIFQWKQNGISHEKWKS